MEMTGLQIKTPGFDRKEWEEIPGTRYSEIIIADNSRPKGITIMVSLPVGSKKPHFVLWGTSGDTSEGQNEHQRILTSENPFTFEVPVAWPGEKPVTRFEPFDNFRVVALNREGHFWQTEIGLATRDKRIFLIVQDQWSGYVVNRGGNLEYVPSQSKHNYPGAPSYSALWSGITEKIESQLRSIKADLSLPRTAPKWNPPLAPAPLPGFPERGVVLYFSPVAGVGRVLSENGEIWFLHFATIKGNDLGVAPMAWVHAKVRKIQPGKQFASITSCKIA